MIKYWHGIVQRDRQAGKQRHSKIGFNYQWATRQNGYLNYQWARPSMQAIIKGIFMDITEPFKDHIKDNILWLYHMHVRG